MLISRYHHIVHNIYNIVDIYIYIIIRYLLQQMGFLCVMSSVVPKEKQNSPSAR